MSRRAKRKATEPQPEPDKPEPETPANHHTSTLTTTPTAKLDSSTRSLANITGPQGQGTVYANLEQAGSQIDETQTPETDLRPTLSGDGTLYDRPTAQNDPALAQRIESLERAVQNLIQYTEASRTIPANGQQQGGLQDIISNGLGFLNKIIGGEQPTGENAFMARMMDMTFNHYTMLDAVLAKQYGIPPPVQHMIIKQ